MKPPMTQTWVNSVTLGIDTSPTHVTPRAQWPNPKDMGESTILSNRVRSKNLEPKLQMSSDRLQPSRMHSGISTQQEKENQDTHQEPWLLHRGVGWELRNQAESAHPILLGCWTGWRILEEELPWWRSLKGECLALLDNCSRRGERRTDWVNWHWNAKMVHSNARCWIIMWLSK